MSNQNGTLYYLPPSTAEVVQRHGEQCKNLALILDKYVERVVIDDSREKGPWLQKRIQGHAIDAELAQNAYRRWKSMMKALNATRFEAALACPIVVGLGGETVLETDITLHHLYAIPIIPASALKGLTRAYVAGEEKAYFVPIDKPEDKRKPSMDEKTDHPDIQRIFGKQERAGTVLFLDALPLDGKATFTVDIMNPHYPDYYKSLKSNAVIAPANDQSPKPIPFLTVTNTTFTFALAPRNPNEPRHKDDVKLVTEWLQKALQNYGVGGKTSAGYGYFTLPSQQKATAALPLSEAQKPVSTPYIRPNMPKFALGAGIAGTVVTPTDELHRRVPEAKAFLAYREFSTKMVLIVVDAEEATQWTPGHTKNCLLVREEEREGCTVLICQPSAGKRRRSSS